MNLRHTSSDQVRVCGAKDRDWPQHSDVCCYHCCHTFTGPPIPWVGSFDDRRAVFRLGHLLFCSWKCLKAYGINVIRSQDCPVAVMFRKLYNKPLSSVPTAPAREQLKEFGGRLTLEQFRSHDGMLRVMPIRLPSGVLAVPCAGHVGALRILYQRPSVPPAVPTPPAHPLEPSHQEGPLQRLEQTGPGSRPPSKPPKAPPSKSGSTSNHNILSLLVKKPKT